MDTTGGNGGQSASSRSSLFARVVRKPIGELLVEAGLIERHHLEEALALQAKKGGKLVQILIALGVFDPHSFINFLAKQPGVASLDLSNYEVPRELVALVPKEFAIRHEVFPIDRLGKLLTLGMVCPLDGLTIGELETKTGLRVKPILCSAEDIRQAINRYYPDEAVAHKVAETPAPAAGQTPENLQGLETSLRLGNVVTLVRHIEALPTLPETVQKVRQVMSDPNSSVEDVANIIVTDPPIAARVLRVANSAAYGFPQRIDNVRLAVSLLGLRETYSLVLTAVIIDRCRTSSKFDYKDFWSSSMECAAACRVVAQACGEGKRSSVSSAGLLHDLGRIALLEVAPEQYMKVDQSLTGAALVAAEEKALGINHAEAGYELASHWSLPAEIAQAIRFHHAPHLATEGKEVTAIVAVADVLYKVVESGQIADPVVMQPLEDRMGMIGLGRDSAVELVKQYAEQRVLDARSGKS